MRRGPGIAGLQRKAASASKYKSVGRQISAQEMERMEDQLQVFKSNLELFAQRYKKDINKNPELRLHFTTMCASIGVDPLASNKGFWSEMLGVGDFYYEVGVQAIQVCMSSRASLQGGLLLLSDLLAMLREMRGPKAYEITESDIEIAVKKMKVLGSGFNVFSVGGRKMVQSVPCELSTDHIEVMQLAQDHDSFVTVPMLQSELGWNYSRIQACIDMLLSSGMVWVDNQADDPQYWFLSLV